MSVSHTAFHIDSHISEIVHASRILEEMQRAHEAEIGAIGLDGQMMRMPSPKSEVVYLSSMSSSYFY
jgi:citrate lyase beta subunit